jgi:hypothetical protein
MTCSSLRHGLNDDGAEAQANDPHVCRSCCNGAVLKLTFANPRSWPEADSARAHRCQRAAVAPIWRACNGLVRNHAVTDNQRRHVRAACGPAEIGTHAPESP